jgi:hypothetical protein
MGLSYRDLLLGFKHRLGQWLLEPAGPGQRQACYMSGAPFLGLLLLRRRLCLDFAILRRQSGTVSLIFFDRAFSFIQRDLKGGHSARRTRILDFRVDLSLGSCGRYPRSHLSAYAAGEASL